MRATPGDFAVAAGLRPCGDGFPSPSDDGGLELFC